ncbi:hypothetical protein HYR69_09690 [Candidatus Sumerlaeota bacterium]|nr:hypothetical protein [Candidatus Sumerlaeota bacterium]MBI3737280.1 hypothetical protein [Candidatus Sumerlaeota bacterium]
MKMESEDRELGSCKNSRLAGLTVVEIGVAILLVAGGAVYGFRAMRIRQAERIAEECRSRLAEIEEDKLRWIALYGRGYRIKDISTLAPLSYVPQYCPTFKDYRANALNMPPTCLSGLPGHELTKDQWASYQSKIAAMIQNPPLPLRWNSECTSGGSDVSGAQSRTPKNRHSFPAPHTDYEIGIPLN